MKELNEQVQAQDEDLSLDQTLNIGSEIVLAGPSKEFPEGIKKNIKIGTIGSISKIRNKAQAAQGMRFSFAIGRPKMEARVIDGQEVQGYDFPAIEAIYRELFGLILVDGLSDAEYESVDEHGIRVLDKVLDRFL